MRTSLLWDVTEPRLSHTPTFWKHLTFPSSRGKRSRQSARKSISADQVFNLKSFDDSDACWRFSYLSLFQELLLLFNEYISSMNQKPWRCRSCHLKRFIPDDVSPPDADDTETKEFFSSGWFHWWVDPFFDSYISCPFHDGADRLSRNVCI